MPVPAGKNSTTPTKPTAPKATPTPTKPDPHAGHDMSKGMPMGAGKGVKGKGK